MAVLRRRRYWCTNRGRCAYAKANHVFGQADYVRHAGRCVVGRHGCGAALQRGEDLDLLPYALGAALFAAGTAALVVTVTPTLRDWHDRLWPPPLEHVHFVQVQSDVNDGAALVIEVRRDALLATAVDVDYATSDGSATDGSDYVGAHGRLHFAIGERSAWLPLTLLPDASYQKPPRHFTLTLVNVAGRPSHRVTITAGPAGPAERASVEALALAASRVAKDIADLRMKQHVADEMMEASRADAGAYAAFRNRLAAASGDLNRARERYLHELDALRQLPPGLVLDAADMIAARFERDGFAQQAGAARVMKRHLRELIDGRAAEMDRWAQELMDVIPRVGEKPRDPPTI